MNEFIAILIFLTFLLIVYLMASNKLSSLLALPLLAITIAFISGIPNDEILNKVLQEGSIKLNVAIITTIIGAILAQVLNKFKIANTLVKYAAEFSGDNPFLIGVILTVITSVLFSTMGGLGAVIMVGTIILPIMLSQGISKLNSAALFLMGISLGGLFNLSNWTFYQQTFYPDKLPQEFINEMLSFIIPFSCIFFIIVLFFLFFNLPQNLKKTNIIYLLILTLISIFIAISNNFIQIKGLFVIDSAFKNIVLTIFLTLIIISWIYQFVNQTKKIQFYALLTPFIPLIFVLIFNWPIIPSFLIGILHGLFSTWDKGHINKFTQSIFEAVYNVAPVIILMMGIGILINTVSHPKVLNIIQPYILAIVPSNTILYVIVFTILAPLTLYRGPLNLFGMGSGIGVMLLNSQILPAGAIMGMLLSVGQIQGVCDPTNTHNIWIANYLKTTTTKILLKTLPIIWLLAILGLIISAIKYL